MPTPEELTREQIDALLQQRGINAYDFPLLPLAEQTRIVAEVERRLSVVEELETVVFANLQRATRLRLNRPQ
jgi:type I restriction enzyme S subunit